MIIFSECLTAPKAKKRWHLDSSCSRHMMGDIDQFFILESKDEGSVTFEDNHKERIIGIGKIKITLFTFTENVLLVDKLKHNLLSISQLCDVGFNVIFKTSMCIVADPLNSNSKFIGHRLGNVYMVDLDDLPLSSSISLIAMDEKNKDQVYYGIKGLVMLVCIQLQN